MHVPMNIKKASKSSSFSHCTCHIIIVTQKRTKFNPVQLCEISADLSTSANVISKSLMEQNKMSFFDYQNTQNQRLINFNDQKLPDTLTVYCLIAPY